MHKIRVGIAGYGNVGRGAMKAVAAAPDMELRAVFTRRDPGTLKLTDARAPVFTVADAENMTDELDVVILCGGSASDLKQQGPWFAALYNIVDSFDTHAVIPEYLAAIDAAAKKTTAIISSGWDPGLFSIVRLLAGAALPDGESYTFWGKGVSQGHSDAIRHIKGVRNAIQYTVPIDSAVEAVRSGAMPKLSPQQKHQRICYVVAAPEADKPSIEDEIKKMPYYFADYVTVVHFIEEGDFIENHSKMPHGGMVLHSGKTGENRHMMEFSLKLDSNPEFTGSIMAAYARAAFRLACDGQYGAKTVLDVPPAYISEKDRFALIKELV